jgi:predicted RND superfamily exporter protein
MNWGNKLLLTFLVFGAGMTYLVYRSVSTNYELVEKDYYKQELRYQQVIDGTNRVNQLSSAVKIEQTDAGILLQLPQEMKEKDITGDVLFYCAYDQKKDKKFLLQTGTTGVQVFQTSSIAPGNYTVKINWSNEGKNYFAEKSLTVL